MQKLGQTMVLTFVPLRHGLGLDFFCNLPSSFFGCFCQVEFIRFEKFQVVKLLTSNLTYIYIHSCLII